jgi:hypothetical protein
MFTRHMTTEIRATKTTLVKASRQRIQTSTRGGTFGEMSLLFLDGIQRWRNGSDRSCLLLVDVWIQATPRLCTHGGLSTTI